MRSSVTHVAGPVVRIQDRVLQRCAVCGDKLLDNIDMSAPDGSMPMWDEGELVSVCGNRATAIGQLEAADVMPEDFCLALVE